MNEARMVDAVTRDENRSIRSDFYRSMTGFVLFAAIMVFIDFVFWDKIPLALMLSWIVMIGLFQLFWLGFIVMTNIRQPVEPEVSQIWEPLSKWIIRGTNSAAILTTWIFLPFADDMMRLALIIFLTMYIPIAIMTATEAAQSDNFTNLGTCLSVAAVFTLWGRDYWWVYVIFALGYAMCMWSLGKHVRTAFREKEEARRDSEIMTVSLADALFEAQVARKTITRFLASASHDLGQPLQAARMFFDASERTRPGAKHDRAVANVHWAFDLIEKQLVAMLDFLRLERGQDAPIRSIVAIGPLLARIAEMHEPSAHSAGIKIHVISSQLHANVDIAFVERAVGNLIGNAIRHAKARRVLVGARRNGAYVRIWVIDDGVGIPIVDQPGLFEDFAQGSNHGDEVRGGFGLGLASAKRLCASMQGSAGFESGWNSGSAFWLDLPST